MNGLIALRATALEAAGAGMRIAGLTVIERSLRQLRHMGYSVLVFGDGTCPVPAGVETRPEAPPDTPIVAADEVRPSNRGIEGGMRVTDETSRRAAEDATFAELLRGDLGFVARHLNKPISFRITRYLLCRLPITPNQVTLAAGLIGLCGAGLIASGGPALIVAGLLLAHVQSILDGCDGELARVRFQQSAIGEWLDTIVDDALNLVLVAALGFGLAATEGRPVFLGMGLLAAVMLLTYNVVAYRELIHQGQGGEVLKIRWWFARGQDLKRLYGKGGQPLFLRVLVAVGRRDFFLLAWVILAAVGLRPLVLLYALGIALANFVVALGQLASRRR